MRTDTIWVMAQIGFPDPYQGVAARCEVASLLAIPQRAAALNLVRDQVTGRIGVPVVAIELKNDAWLDQGIDEIRSNLVLGLVGKAERVEQGVTIDFERRGLAAADDQIGVCVATRDGTKDLLPEVLPMCSAIGQLSGDQEETAALRAVTEQDGGSQTLRRVEARLRAEPLSPLLLRRRDPKRDVTV